MEDEANQNVGNLVEELRSVLKLDKEVADINRLLDSMMNVSETAIGDATELDQVFLALLSHDSKEIVAKTAKTIAEIAKSQKGREKCTSSSLVKALLDLLKEDRVDVLTQTSRALGNICYANENGKKFLEEENGLKLILAVVEKSVAFGRVEGASTLRNVAAGLLLNFLIDGTSLQKEAFEQGTVGILQSVLEADGAAESEAAVHVLLILGILNDSGLVFLDERLTKVLVDILADEDTSSELSEMCLELLHGQAEDENAKLLLANAGVCELLLKLLEKHSLFCTDEETRSVLKMACNLIVLVLTGDDSMNALYDDSNGLVYRKLVEWLDSEDRDLQIAAVLAMGNFARTDAHCKLMVAQGVHRSLLKLLRRNDAETADIRFQHALLSALRNLAIPADNKPVILKDGLIDVLYPMLNIPTFPVVFKLLGTLRIVIDGQREAAVDLGKRDGLIKKTAEWCATEDHPGVQGEAHRLIAWLIENSRNKEIALSIVKHGAVKYLTKMVVAPHPLMINEALISLNILFTICSAESEDALVEADVGEKLCRFFERANDLSVPIVSNAVSLLESISNSDVLKMHLRKSGVPAACQEATRTREDASIKEKLQTLCDKLN